MSLQVIRLVEGGQVDKMIAFDRLPDSIMTGIRKKDLSGLARYWKQFSEEGIQNGTTYNFHYFLDYRDVNTDKEKWGEISQYVRRAVDLKTRLLDRLEDMAINMAPDPKSPDIIDPETIPVIKLPVELILPKDNKAIITEKEAFVPQETIPEVTAKPKQRGRPKKVSAGV